MPVVSEEDTEGGGRDRHPSKDLFYRNPGFYNQKGGGQQQASI